MYIAIVLTSLVTAVLTAVAVVVALRGWWRRRLGAALDAKLEEAGDNLRSQVKTGVLDGFKEGIEALPKDVLRSTTRNVTKTGFDIVEEGLSTLLGTPKRPR